MAGAGIRMRVVRQSRISVGTALQNGSERARQGVKDVLRTGLELHQKLTMGLCPVDTGRMASNTRVDIDEGGYEGTVGWHSEDFTSEMIVGADGVARPVPFYPPYVIYGTRFQPAQDCLTPPEPEVRRFIVAGVTRVLTTAWQ